MNKIPSIRHDEQMDTRLGPGSRTAGESSQAQSRFEARTQRSLAVRVAGHCLEAPCRRRGPGVDAWGRSSWAVRESPVSLLPLSRAHIVALDRQCGPNVLARTSASGFLRRHFFFSTDLREAVFILKTDTWCLSPLKWSSCGGVLTSRLILRNLCRGRILFWELNLYEIEITQKDQ